MAKVSFETVQTMSPDNKGGNGVAFFSLKNDGDEAIVRIMHDSTEDFDMLICHNAKVGDRFKKINCIRDPRETVDKCPLCASGAKVQTRFFVHMIQYENVNGKITPKAVVWERDAKEYGNKLKSMMSEYGPLSDCIFKIKRNGKAGSMDTTYELMFGNPNIYNANLYPKMPELFEGYTALGTAVVDKDYNALSTFVATGSFDDQSNATTTSTPTRTNLDTVVDAEPYNAPTGGNGRMPWEAGTGTAIPNRPTRTY